MTISLGEANLHRREKARVGLPHLFTRTPVSAGPEDSEGNATKVQGASTTGLSCRYRAEETLRTDVGGSTTIYRPSLSLLDDSPLQVGDLVSAITTKPPNAVVLLAGPLEVERIIPSAAFGPVLSLRAYLRAGEVRL